MAHHAARRAHVRSATAPDGPAALPLGFEEDALDWLENQARRPSDAPASDGDRVIFVVGVLLFAAALAGALRH